MRIDRTFIHAMHGVLVALAASGSAQALVIRESVQAPAEPCTVDLARYLLPPAELLDCDDPNCARLVPALRRAAQTRDAREILVRAAFEYYVLRRPELLPLYGASPGVAQALADLAVTGGAAYDTFRRLAPSEATLAGLLQQRLQTVFPAHVPVPGDVSAAIRHALHRSYEVAWAIRGPTPYRMAHRDRLGWIAVEAEDDPPHRPVNMPSAPFPQYNMTVRVGAIDVVTRYMVASRSIADDHAVDTGTVPPDRQHPLIVGDVVLFIHGHSSSVEEAVTLAGPLLAQATARGRPMTLIAMDLPSNGYASMIDDRTVADPHTSRWNVAYPILDFIEAFVVAFVDGLEIRQPGIKGQIVGVIGGSLGGNMTLRLARRDPAVYPWVRNAVSWSPASSWLSWARADLRDVPAKGRFFHPVKGAAVAGAPVLMMEAEDAGSLHKFFHGLPGGTGGRIDQSDRWYSEQWPCREEAKTTSHRALYEIYNDRFRRWHFRVAYEQLIYSHWDSDNPDPAVDPDPRNDPAAGSARYSQIRARLMLAAGEDDNFFPEKLFDETKGLAEAMTMLEGEALLFDDTGHSIHAERPAFFAGEILRFLFASPAPPFPAFLVPATSF